MNKRKIYYRRKENKIIAEGIMKNKTVYLFTLPNPEKLLITSLFTLDKIAKIKEKIARLDYKTDKPKKQGEKVRSIKIARTPKEDGEDEDIIFDPQDHINQIKQKGGFQYE